MQVGFLELIIVLLVLMVLFGPAKLPTIARSLGTTMRAYREGLGETSEWRESSEGAAEDEVEVTSQIAELKRSIATMQLLKDRVTVFIASAMVDLQRERRTAAEAVQSLLATRPWLFEDHGGPEREYVRQVCLEAVAESHIFMVLVGTTVSGIVVEEYKTAMSTNKPVLAFVKHCQHDDLAMRFLERLGQEGITWTVFEDADDLDLRVRAAILNHIVKRYKDYGLGDHDLSVLVGLAKAFDDLLASRRTQPDVARQPSDSSPRTSAEGSGEEWQASESRRASIVGNTSASTSRVAAFHRDIGNTYLGLDRYTDAVVEYTVSIGLDPSSAMAFRQRSYCYESLGRYRLAIVDAEAALKLSETPLAYFRRAEGYRGEKNYDAALADIRSAIELDPDNSYGFLLRSEIQSRKGDHRAALSDANMAVRLSPSDIGGFLRRSEVRRNVDDYNASLVDALKAIEIDPASPRGYAARSQTYIGLGRLKEALSDASRAIELDPKYASGYIARSLVYSRMGDWRRAVEDASRAIQERPRSADAYLRRAGALKAAGHTRRAKADLHMADRLG